MRRPGVCRITLATKVVPLLFRRRMVWVPTVWGALLLFGAALLCIGALGWFANDLLALTAPARGPDGHGARTLVVEGWMPETDLSQAVEVFRRGGYGRVLVTGGPIDASQDLGGWKTFAVRGAALLVLQGVPQSLITAVPAPAVAHDRTYQNGLAVRAWAQQHGVALQAVDVFTAGVHARRSRLVYRMALGDAVEVGAIASVPADFDATHWWRSSDGAKTTMGEALSWAWTVCCFWPPPTDQAPFTSPGTAAPG